MTEAEEQGSNPSDATTASDVPSQGYEGPGTAQAAPTAAVPNASSIAESSRITTQTIYVQAPNHGRSRSKRVRAC